MKTRHVLFINIIFFAFMLFSAGVVYQFMTGNKPLDILHAFHAHKPVQVTTTACSTQKALSLTGVQNQQLQKLSVYQEACHSFAAGTVMMFVGIPMSTQDAVAEATQTAVVLKTFAK